MTTSPPSQPSRHPLLSTLRPPDRRVRWVSLGAAVGLHLALGVAAFFHVVTAEPPPPEKARVRVPLDQAILLPPPPRKPVLRPRTEIRLQSPVPDPRPDEPEPIVDEYEEIVFTPVNVIPEMVWGEDLRPPDPVGTLHLTAEMSPPRLIPGTRVQPVYPERCLPVGLEGTVLLRAVIHRDGTVGEVEVVKAPRVDLGFSESAVEAVRQWRYHPARLHGRPVEVYFTIEVVFRLDG